MAVAFELRVEDRLADRVIVSVQVKPSGEAVAVEGIAVELFSRTDESLSSRVLLPVSGLLNAAVGVRVEVRASAPIPHGATVVGTAWWEGGMATVRCPTDPGTELEAHMRGRRTALLCGRDEFLESMSDREWQTLACAFPWLSRVAAHRIDRPIDANTQSLADEVTDELDLDPESAEWLRELLKEDS